MEGKSTRVIVNMRSLQGLGRDKLWSPCHVTDNMCKSGQDTVDELAVSQLAHPAEHCEVCIGTLAASISVSVQESMIERMMSMACSSL